MRRAALIVVAVAVAGAAALGAGGSEPTGYRVDAIFDNVAFLTDGTDVRVAGATVGEVLSLEVTPDHKGRVQMRIEDRFAPFRSDADCTIQPQSLIGERFVQCTPGTPEGAPLAERGGRPPTVPVANTHAPIDLDLILGSFDRPARERLGILLGSLGAGLAGRGEDLNAAILRANPALQETRRVLDVLGQDRARLQQLIADGDTVLDALADRKARVAGFVRSAADVTTQTGRRRARLAETVRRLPPFLDQARPAMARLTQFARAGTPLMADLGRSGPGVRQLVADTATFATRVRPTLDRLRPVLRQTRRAVPDIAPQARRLKRFAADAKPAGALAGDLMESLRDQGAFEGLGAFFHYAVAATARFDRFSHILPAYVLATPCVIAVKTPTPGCASKYASFGAPQARARTRERPARRPQRRQREPAPAAPQATPAPREQAPPERRPALPRLPDLPDVPLLPDLNRVPDALGDLGPGRDADRREQPARDRDLLDFLLG